MNDLKRTRLKVGISRRDLADRIGVTYEYIRKLEEGLSQNPSAIVMNNISKVLGCSVEELFFC